MDNPQDLINQALGGNTPTTKAEPATPTLPTPEPISPATTAESPTETTSAASETPTTSVQPVATQQQPAPAMDAVVPTELTNDNGTMTTATAVPDATATEQPVMPEISNVEAKGEDVPLALVGVTSVATDTATTIPTHTVEPVANPVVPPALNQDAPTMDSQKPKKRMGKIISIVAGFFLLLGVVGAVSYQMLSGESLIAYVNKFTRDDSGKVIINPDWDPNAVNPNTGKTQEEERNEALGIKQEENKSGLPAEKAGCGKAGCCGDGYEYCGGAINKCVSFGALSAAGGGCNKYGEVNYGIASVYGANPGQGACDPDAVKSELATECSCGGKTYCFDRRGSCNSTTVQRIGDQAGTVDTGFCGLVGYIPSGSTTFKEYPGLFCTQADVNAKVSGCDAVGDLKYEYTCDMNGCQTTDASCQVVKYACNGTSGSNSCTDNSSTYISGSMSSGTSKTFSGKCGTVEQIDVTCGGYKMSRTRVNPECTEKEITTTENNPSPSPSGSVSFMCNTLTRTPTTTPAMGDKVTFTCAGAATPAGSVSLTYKFRYNINDGAYTALANKTATTAEMTVAQCGRYKVQCQTCGTINGVLSCDPVWTPATKQ